jgi:hypothetical protein
MESSGAALRGETLLGHADPRTTMGSRWPRQPAKCDHFKVAVAVNEVSRVARGIPDREENASGESGT